VHAHQTAVGSLRGYQDSGQDPPPRTTANSRGPAKPLGRRGPGEVMRQASHFLEPYVGRYWKKLEDGRILCEL